MSSVAARPKFDALPVNDDHDRPQGYGVPSLTEQQQCRSHGSTATSSLLVHEQELETPDNVVSPSQPMQSVIACEDLQSSNSALLASKDNTGPKTSLHGHSTVETAEGSQKLTVGWKTIALLLGFYLIALLVAILHFVMMHYLNGKSTDDRKYLAQPYVTSLSLLLVAIFKASLCASLAVAFTQHMWKILRHKALQVSSIESLHGVRYNPLLLGKWRLFLATPLLYLMAMVMWSLTIAILFPPSALTITLSQFQESKSLLVPTFDAGYGRDFEINRNSIIGTSSLSSWAPGGVGVTADTNGSASMLYSNPNAKLVHLSHVVLVSGAIPESVSPCGANCTYIVDFEGPVFQCINTIRNQTSQELSGPISEYYSGAWSSVNSHHRTSQTFTMNLTRILGHSRGLWLQELHILQCQPAWAMYQVKLEYVNGLRSFVFDIVPGGKLVDTFVSGTSPNTTQGDTGWTMDQIRNLKNINHYSLLDTIATALGGSYEQMLLEGDGPTFPYTLSNGTVLDFSPIEASFTLLSDFNLVNSLPRVFGSDNLDLQPNKTWIRDTAFNKNRYNVTSNGPSLEITGEILNEIVANVTIAAMLGYYPLSIWNITAIANITTYRNTYSFSRPANLILPYALFLVFSLPFLILGYLSLRSNRVAALSDSFLQLLVTVTRSEKLDRIARPCEHGGDEMANTELKNTRIMFGELSAADEREDKLGRMGFGLEAEILRSRFREK
ncbi:hypothetical protein BU25DRAFT_411210 [Macroventuria anomochaeta]|uniref:Uncharacterized protein n=1 Tax=Macroventuria anomochaeta TaxID=301207 RepID=A0ACB6S155_9PLEO|nr:uncharacterized protein BU25DRAFT_411210 [Macroventuria anomochaeta]KAF2627128.1 hypothetical protein BU25DRAFT_411210 [Macroventuria anomochaeta]